MATRKSLSAIDAQGLYDKANQAYSDSNAPETLERTLLATGSLATPTAGESLECSPDGKTLWMKASDGTLTQIGPQPFQVITAPLPDDANSTYLANMAYFCSVSTTNGWPISGMLSGFRGGNVHTQRVQGSLGATYERGWNSSTSLWMPWLMLKSGSRLTSRLTAAATSSIVGYASTGLQVSLAAGVAYTYRATGHYQTAALTTGIGLRVGGTATGSTRNAFTVWGVTGASVPTKVVTTALAATMLTTAVAAAATDYQWEIEGLIRVTAAGTFGVTFASEVAGSLVTIQPDSFLVCEEIS